MIIRLLSWLIRGVVFAAGVSVVLAVCARFADGPIGPFPGGTLRRGEIVEGEISDWSFVRRVSTIELQTNDPLLARRTWIIYHRGAVFVPCMFPQFQSWPHDLLLDDSVVLRIKGKLYKRSARRISNPVLIAVLDAEMYKKYGRSWAEDGDDSNLWFFRMDPRYK
ncbi:MAG: hypothetical protein IH884_01625 [Myxococcales bacterium]|nr:hypothetical protein [Myxococcales bacterium]